MTSLSSDEKPQDDPKKDEEDANQESWDNDHFILLLPYNWVGKQAGREEDLEEA